MNADARKYLFDARQAAGLGEEFCRGRTFESYQLDALLRSAVERQFEIVGEALGRLSKLDAALVARIADAPRIIAFRNVLIHGYATISNKLVWSVVTDDLPALIATLEALLHDDHGGNVRG